MNNPTGHITENFRWEEFWCKCYECTMPDEVQDKVILLCTRILQPIRTELGVPITICSGYRCPEHNAARGGVSRSQHMRGAAADIVIAGYSPRWVYRYIEKHFNPGGLGKYRSFTHVDIRIRPKGKESRW